MLRGPPRRTHPFGEGPEIAEHRLERPGAGAAVGPEMRRETFDERRTDDDGVGGAGHLPRLFRVLDAEAGGDRQRREAAQPSGKPSARIQTISCGSVTMVIAGSGPAASASRDDSAAGKAARSGAISRSRRVVRTVSIISVASFLERPALS